MGNWFFHTEAPFYMLLGGLLTGALWLGLTLYGSWQDRKAEELWAKRHRALGQYRAAWLNGFNFAVGKGGLPPEIIDWPSAIKEVTQDHDHNCS